MELESTPIEDWPLYSQMMLQFFLAAHGDNDIYFNKGLDILKSGKIDVFDPDYDNQIFRELRCGRWMAPKCRAICNEIMKLTNMTMEDIRVHIAKIYQIYSWSEYRWVEYENCDCEGVCMKSH
jgi:hypothetical protein